MSATHYHDAVTRRFTQADTIIPGGGNDPQALNRYSYVNNNPINYTDPTRHDTTRARVAAEAAAGFGKATRTVTALCLSGVLIAGRDAEPKHSGIP